MIEIQRVRNFSNEQDYVAFSIVRLYNKHVTELGGRNTWVCIESGGKKIYRRVRGVGNMPGFPKDAMELDYDSRNELGAISDDRHENGFFLHKATIKKASLVEKFLAHWSHPNIEYRTPFQISYISFMLGIIGLILGMVSLFR